MTTESGHDAFIVAGGHRTEIGITNVEALEGDHWNDEGYADLPETTGVFCIIKINSTTIIAVGGICTVTFI